MVFNKRDLERAFSPNKVRKFGKKPTSGISTTSKPSSSGSTFDSVEAEGGSQTKIRVIVRVRPHNEKETQENYRTVIKVIDDKMLIFDPKEEENPFFYRGTAQKGRDMLKKQNKELQFMFDKVFDMSCSNQEVFEGTTKDTISNLLDGYNCSVFAYGATGAGKTHTMLGREGDPGITYRTMAELFSQIEAQSDHRDFNLGVTYLEVYNENVRDLLHKSGPLAIRDDGRHGIIVAGLKIITIYSAEELLTLLARGNKNRTQHPTDANEESSRSHAVFQVYVNVTNKLDGQVKHVKLSMIDLAGSERASATGCKGARFKEGANINKSLLALGNCINNLADGIKHIPYRDSKLTRLLKDSLGGNCQTVMIANVGPSSHSFEDTYNTLRYANRAKKIKTSLKKNIISCQMHVTGYIKMVEEQKKEINMLKQKLLNLESKSIDRNISSPESEDSNNESTDKEFIQMNEKMIELQSTKRALNEKILSLQSTDKILCCKIQYKLAADKRLRNLTATVDATSEEQNASGKSRVNKSLTHFKRQRDLVKVQMESAWNELQAVELEIATLNTAIKNKNFSSKLIDKCSSHVLCEIENTRLQQQFEHSRKVCSLQQCEMQSCDTIIRSMSSTLQNYYNMMRGYGTMTDKMKLEFKELVKSLEGVRNVRFADSDTDKYWPEDSYVLTSLSTEELKDPFNSEMPIHTAAYLDEEEPEKITNALSTTFDATPREVEQHIPAAPQPSSPSLNSTVTLDTESSSERPHVDIDEDAVSTDSINANQLNSTFNLMESNAKKRTITEKKNCAGIKTPFKKPRKISPKKRFPLALTGKENKTMSAQANAADISAKKIAILNRLKTDRLKSLSQLSNASVTSGPSNRSLKAVRPKERRGLIGTHPYNKPNAKANQGPKDGKTD